ncbi:hypothetical protein POL68_23335 [Stigmatella sp. ncwal1]|uniref:Carboxypeptidase regulatory-like domain-containing protein n=1 Tax=Stigmatella ashevillensis TaxID=2995309 RepID=A0ABT5DCS7_9BACT|nr:hypothetical protein [Stigmatella ashevillena]MDC0711424.1 hypothetical protein [Stigmatella ashevillena]
MRSIGFIRFVLTGLLLACGGKEAEEAFDPQLSIHFPEEGGLGTLPFRTKGDFTVRLGAVIPGLCKPVQADVELITPSKPEGATVVAQATLVPQEPCEELAGEVRLAWPEAGEVQVRATLGGFAEVATISVDTPAVAIGVDTERGNREGLGFRYPFCIESSAAAGQVQLLLQNAALLGGGDAAHLSLSAGGCPARLLASPRATHYGGTLLVTSAAFGVGAALLGTSVVTEPKQFQSEPPGTLALDVAPGVEELPPAGEVLDVTVSAALDGVAAYNVPIRIETVPATQVLPASGFTDTAGTFRASLIVPAYIQGMRIDAIAGGIRSGRTLRRIPLKP